MRGVRNLLLDTGRAVSSRPTADRGGVSPPALAVAVLVAGLAVVIVATGGHEIIADAMRDALETVLG